MTNTIKVSLSRGHKLVERLTRVIHETSAEISNLVAPMQLNVVSEISKISEITDKIQEKMKYRNSLYEALKELRTVIAQKNAGAKIPEMLAQKAILVHELKTLQEIYGSAKNNTSHSVLGRNNPVILPNEKEVVTDYFLMMQNKETVTSVKVEIASKKLIDSLEEEINSVKNKIDFVSDEINDLNAKNRISFEVSDEISKALGIK